MDAAQRTGQIVTNARRLLGELPAGVRLVAAAKGRTSAEVRAAIAGGVRSIGHNYVNEAARMRPEVEVHAEVRWHMIGHLQRNKARSAVETFDMVETVDSWRLALELDRRLAIAGRVGAVLVEVNSAREASKSGVLPEDVLELVVRMLALEHLRLEGLMTVGPAFGDLEAQRSCFRLTRALLDRARDLGGAPPTLRHLSMGMSDSYRTAIEEGATLVRIGTALFGPRPAAR